MFDFDVFLNLALDSRGVQVAGGEVLGTTEEGFVWLL
jgi:hypothetical protein